METQPSERAIQRMSNHDALNKDARQAYHMTVPVKPGSKLSRWGRGPKLSPFFLKKQAAEINNLSKHSG